MHVALPLLRAGRLLTHRGVDALVLPVKKFDQPFAVDGVKANASDAAVNESLAKNLPAGGFESRLSEMLGDRLDRAQKGTRCTTPKDVVPVLPAWDGFSNPAHLILPSYLTRSRAASRACMIL